MSKYQNFTPRTYKAAAQSNNVFTFEWLKIPQRVSGGYKFKPSIQGIVNPFFSSRLALNQHSTSLYTVIILQDLKKSP